MSIEVWWGSGSPFAWRVLLALEFKRLKYESHLLQFSKGEHKAAGYLKINPRGRVPALRDGAVTVHESQAILHYLDRAYPEPPLFGRTPAETAEIMKQVSECLSYFEPELNTLASAVFGGEVDQRQAQVKEALGKLREELKLIEDRLEAQAWLAGEFCSAADITLFPSVQLLMRALSKPAAAKLEANHLSIRSQYPALARWIVRVEGLPGYDRTYPPHWRA